MHNEWRQEKQEQLSSGAQKNYWNTYVCLQLSDYCTNRWRIEASKNNFIDQKIREQEDKTT